MELFSKIAEYVHTVGIDDCLLSSTGVVCAFSGGADSSVLLRFLKKYLAAKSIPLYAAHMNHLIRGKESDADEEFCRKVCDELGVPLKVMRADIPSLSEKSGTGLEETARNERYRFLKAAAKELGASHVATAHSASDNLESVIFNLARGSSVCGMAGISPVRDGMFIRPMLSCTSEEIREFAKSENIPFVIDSTNSDTEYTRNFIRSEIVPKMKKLNPKVEAAVSRLSDAARCDCAYIDSIVENVLGNDDFLNRNDFRKFDRAVKSRIITALYKRATGTGYDLSAVNIADCVSLGAGGGVGSVSLPAGVTFFAHKDAVFIGKDGDDEKTPEETALETGKITVFGDFAVGIWRGKCAPPEKYENIYNLFIKETLDCDKINGNLLVRTRRPGDRFLLHGVNRSVKKLMCDENIPQRIRDRLPFICDGDEIVLIPTIPPRDGAWAHPGNENILTVCIYRKQ